LLAAVTAAAWIGLSAAFPDLAPAGVPLGLALILFSNGVILLGLWRGLARTRFSASERVTVWLVLAVALILWIAIVWTLAVRGTFLPRAAANRYVPALPIAIFVPVILGLGLLTSSQRIASLLEATPPAWLVGLQVYRVLGGIFLVDWMRGLLPGAFAVPAGIGDIIVGLLALPAAVWVASGTPIGRRVGTWWNLLGLADFVVAIGMGMTTSPGRFQLFALDHPNAQIGTFPTVMIPAFAVPNSIILHALSLWQLKRLGRTTADLRAVERAGRAISGAESA
jgi:hypothetical protein